MGETQVCLNIDGKKPTEQERMKTDNITANFKFLKNCF